MITLTGATESVTKSLDDHNAAWTAFRVVHHLDVLEHLATATTLGWKVADKTALYANLETIGAKAEQIHIGTVNGRFIASAVLHEPFEGLRIVKIMERRPGSSDPLGLDSVDHLVKDQDEIYKLLQSVDAHVERQHNTMSKWLSLRFGKNLEYEAKFTDKMVVDVAIKELEQARTRILKTIG